MPDAAEPITGLKELLEMMFATANETHHTTLDKYIELERALLEQYQKYIADQFAVNDDVLQNFTKLMMSSWMQIVTFQRENRSRFLELQSTMADAHLRFLERLSDSVSMASHAAPSGGSPDAD
jgi:hypothetical protein